MKTRLSLVALVGLAVACGKPTPPPASQPAAPSVSVAAWQAKHRPADAVRIAGNAVPEAKRSALVTNAVVTPYLPATDPEAQGPGKAATGGAVTCIASNHSATGSGSFSACARQSNVNVVFADAGPFTVDSQQTYIGSNITIDGCANGQNGVTLAQPSDMYRAVVMEGPGSNVILRCLRFQGTAKTKTGANTEHDLVAFDGTSGAISRVFVDRCTFNQATDGALDIVGDVSEVTVQRSLLYENPMTQLIKYQFNNRFPRNISLHHNVYTQNGERNPQMRGAVVAEFVNNVVGPSKQIIDAENGQPFSQYGGLLWNSTDAAEESTGNVKVNVVGNAYVGTFDADFGPLQIRTDSGASASGIYIAGNQCTGCPSSPASSPNAFSSPATATPLGSLAASLANAGAPNRTSADTSALNAALSLVGGGGPIPTPTPSPVSTPTPSPTVAPTPTPSPTVIPPTPTPTPVPTPIPTPAPGAPSVVSNTCGSKAKLTTANGKLTIAYAWSFFSGSCTVVVK